MSEQAGVKEGKRTSLLKTIKGFFQKASISLSIATSKLRSIAEEVLSSDEVVNELFLVTSSSSVDPSLLYNSGTQDVSKVKSKENSDQTQDETQALSSMSNVTSKVNSIPAYLDFNSVAEANALREENIPFTDGGKVWHKRRTAWLNATTEEKLQAKHHASESVLSVVPKESYSVVYHNLVDKQKTLKKPLNLRDAVKVINAGWHSSGKWEKAAQGIA